MSRSLLIFYRLTLVVFIVIGALFLGPNFNFFPKAYAYTGPVYAADAGGCFQAGYACGINPGTDPIVEVGYCSIGYNTPTGPCCTSYKPCFFPHSRTCGTGAGSYVPLGLARQCTGPPTSTPTPTPRPNPTPTPRPNIPPTGSISGPTTLGVDEVGNFTATGADSDGDLTSVKIYAANNTDRGYSNKGSTGCSGSQCTLSSDISFNSPGTYTVIVNVNEGVPGDRCSGNPWYDYAADPSWVNCGLNSSITVTVSPSCAANAPCNLNACGSAGGTIQCDGTCSGGVPPLPGGYGNACGFNSCNDAGGTIQCDGTCSAQAGERAGYGQACTVCSSPNSCGQTNCSYGTNVCSGSGVACNATVPAAPPNSQCTSPQVTDASINLNPVVANSANQYVVTVTATDPNGGNNITSEYAQFEGGRGVMIWTSVDNYQYQTLENTEAPGTSRPCNQGRAALLNDSGAQYITLHGCSTYVIDRTRYVYFTISFNTNYTDPFTNYIDGHATNVYDAYDGWRRFGFFNLNAAPTATSVTISAPLGPSGNPLVMANNSDKYEITIITTDLNGGDDIKAEYLAIDGSYSSGFLVWSEKAWLYPYFPPSATLVAGQSVPCGTGTAGIYSGSPQFVYALVGCTTSTVGTTRTLKFTVRFLSSFTSPVTGNYFSVFSSDNADQTLGWQGPFGQFELNIGPRVESASINPTPVDPGNTLYTITATATDPNLGNDIRNQYILINYQGPNAGPANYRGYLGWSIDTTFPSWAQTRGQMSCQGGGYAAINTDSNSYYGSRYIQNLLSCSTSIFGTKRIVSFTFRFSPSFNTPVTNNTISQWAMDSANQTNGWTPFDAFNLNQYTISGSVFNDLNGDAIFQPPRETNYTASDQTLVLKRGNNTVGSVVANRTTGTYTLPAGSGGYTVEYQGPLPAGYQVTSPRNGPPPSFSVVLGPGCSTGGAPGASCNGNNIQNLNFGITNSSAWFQCIGGDCRIDSSFSDPISATAVPACGGSNASVANPPVSQNPGVVYVGDSVPPYFGGGNSSSTDWVVGRPPYSELFSPAVPGVYRTSCEYYLALVQQSAIAVTDLATVCNGGLLNCALPRDGVGNPTLAPGVYQANGDLTLQTYTFPTVPLGKGFVFLVKGTLRVKGDIIVPIGSHATFAATHDIIFDRSVGVSSGSTVCDPRTQAGCNVEGFYSADENIIIDGRKNCSLGADLRLNIAGSVVANAAKRGGSIQNIRDLCAGNLDCPSYSVTERPDLILNAPDFLKHANFIWQEAAP